MKGVGENIKNLWVEGCKNIIKMQEVQTLPHPKLKWRGKEINWLRKMRKSGILRGLEIGESMKEKKCIFLVRNSIKFYAWVRKNYMKILKKIRIKSNVKLT